MSKHIMDLQVGTEITFGPPIMFSDLRHDQYAPEWTEIPNDIKLSDIYAELVQSRKDIQALREELQNTRQELYDEIHQIPWRVALPLDIRIRRWLRRFFGRKVD